VEVDLAKVSLSFSKRDRLVEFLNRRMDGRSILLPLIKTMIEERDPLVSIARTFDLINARVCKVVTLANATGSDNSGMAQPTMSSNSARRSASDTHLPQIAQPRNLTPMSRVPSSPMSLLASPIGPKAASLGSSSNEIGSVPSSPFSLSNDCSPAVSPSSLPSISIVFNGPLAKKKSNMGPAMRTKKGYSVITQTDMYVHVLLPLDDDKVQVTSNKYFIAVVTEYIRSLGFYKIPIEDCIYQLLISILVQDKRYYQLHQLLQYHIIDDSIHVACQLLSLEKLYSPSYQLALDMLKRLLSRSNVVVDQIVEVLLMSGQFLTALRFIENHKDAHYSVQRFLDAALSAGDEILFYSVYRFFEKRGEITEECIAHTQSFHLLFNAHAQSPATTPNSTLVLAENGHTHS